MDDAEEMVGLARELAADIVTLARRLLASGADLGRIHREYVVTSVDLLNDAELHGLLGAAGDQGSRDAIEESVSQLARLRRKARAELERQEDEDRD